VAQCCKELLKALTLTCGVVDWLRLWYSEWSWCLPALRLLHYLTLHARCYKLQPLEVQVSGRKGASRPAK
jgi:hypothetical protein